MALQNKFYLFSLGCVSKRWKKNVKINTQKIYLCFSTAKKAREIKRFRGWAGNEWFEAIKIQSRTNGNCRHLQKVNDVPNLFEEGIVVVISSAHNSSERKKVFFYKNSESSESLNFTSMLCTSKIRPAKWFFMFFNTNRCCCLKRRR